MRSSSAECGRLVVIELGVLALVAPAAILAASLRSEPGPARAAGPSPIAGTLRATPATLALRTVYVGQRRTYPIVVRNDGDHPITISSVRMVGSGLSAALAVPRTVPRRGSTWFAVTYAPASAGDLAGAIVLEDGGGRTFLRVPVTGTGVTLEEAARISVVSHGARGDGVTDDRAAFQSAADAAGRQGKVLYVPQPPGGKHYKLTGVVHIQGSVVGEPGLMRPEIRMYGANGAGNPGAADPYTIFSFRGNETGSVITGLHLNGGRDFAPGTNVYGMLEYSQGIALQDVSDVTIENNLIENTQGDCILIGGGPGTSPCVNVWIIGNVLRHPMRCAVFPADTRGLKVYLNTINKVVQYQGAIGFEPNLPPQASWDAEVAYNDFATTLLYDHGVMTSNLATRIREPGGRIDVHDNRGVAGRHAFHLDLVPPGTRSAWIGNTIQRSLLSSP